MNMKEELLRYAIMIPIRYNRNQKTAFIDMMIEDAKKLNLAYRSEKMKTRFFECTNLIIGDLQHADTVFMTAYDTPQRNFFAASRYYPLHSKKNQQIQTLEFLIHLILLILACVITVMLLFSWNQLVTSMKIGYVLMLGVFALMLIYMSINKASKVNMNRNSASVAIMYKLMKEKPRKTAFVFLDHAVSSYEGYKELLQDHDLSKKKVIILDSLAKGEKIVCATLQKESCFKDHFQTVKYDKTEACDNVLHLMPYAYLLVSADHDEFYVDTKKDDRISMEQVNMIYEILYKSLIEEDS